MEFILTFYLLGFLLASGYLYMSIEQNEPNSGTLNRMAGGIILGSLSWVVVGIIVHKMHNRNIKVNQDGKIQDPKIRHLHKGVGN